MQTIDWAKWSAISEILSAIAIVVTLLYLALQNQYLADQTALMNEQNVQNNELLRQNNELMEAEARRARTAFSEEGFRLVADNQSLAELLAKDEAGETLSRAESTRMIAFWQRGWVYMEAVHAELGESELAPLLRRHGLFARIYPSFGSSWSAAKPYFNEQFVQFFDETVFGE